MNYKIALKANTKTNFEITKNRKSILYINRNIVEAVTV